MKLKKKVLLVMSYQSHNITLAYFVSVTPATSLYILSHVYYTANGSEREMWSMRILHKFLRI